MVVVAGDHLFQDRDGLGDFGAVVFEGDVVQVEVEYIPLSLISSKASDFVLRDIFIRIGWTSVWLEAFLRA